MNKFISIASMDQSVGPKTDRLVAFLKGGRKYYFDISFPGKSPNAAFYKFFRCNDAADYPFRYVGTFPENEVLWRGQEDQVPNFLSFVTRSFKLG